jgi:hypothetical protein
MAVLFISYAHEDEDWRRLIESHLKVLTFGGLANLEVWSDTKLESGSDWKAALEEKMEAAGVAILIVTQFFISSDFILREELPYLLQRREANQKLTIIPVLASPCAYEFVPTLSQMQFRTAGGLPLEAVPKYEQNTILKDLVKEVRKALAPEEEPRQPLDESRQPPPPPGPQEQLLALDVSLRHRLGEEYQVELRYTDPKEPTENRSLGYRARIKLASLEGLRGRPEDYANSLSRQLFAEGAPRAVLDVYTERLGQRAGMLRVNIEATARDLHRVFWETLPLVVGADSPADGSNPVFGRSVSAAGESWPSPFMSAWPKLAINVCYLPPTDSPDSPGELQDIESAFRNESIACVVLRDQIELKRIGQLSSSILFLLVHFDSGGLEPVVIGQGGEGGPAACSFEDFSLRIKDLISLPQVIILDAVDDPGSTESGIPVEETLMLLASELISTGICAVVTRQAPMERQAWTGFLAKFASELRNTGNLDSAAHEARSAAGRADGWKPVVFTRIRTGQLWYRPMFLSDSATAWELLVENIRDGLCIPIIGPLVNRHVVRSRGDIAERLASKYHYPGAREERRDLRKVAQYVATTREPRRVRREYEQAVVQYLSERYGDAVKDLGSEVTVLRVLNAVWESVLHHEAEDSFNLLAGLRLPLYLTTNLHNYLSLAIAGCCGVQPHTGDTGPVRAPRNRIFTDEEKILGEEEDLDDRKFAFNKDHPLVYHLFGRIDSPETMVLTEDDHFRFLLRFNGKWTRLPLMVRSRISDSSLLFLGFDLAEWEFRSVFRALLEIAGSDVFRRNTHIAVQINVDDDTIMDPERAQNYLVEYFKQISIKPYVFMGSAQEFLSALTKRLKDAGLV